MLPSGWRTAMMSMAPFRCGVTYASVLPTAMPAAKVPLCTVDVERFFHIQPCSLELNIGRCRARGEMALRDATQIHLA